MSLPRLSAALDGAREDENEGWKQTTYLAHALGAHGKKSLSQVWSEYGLIDKGQDKRKPTKAELQDRMKRAEAIYRKANDADI